MPHVAARTPSRDRDTGRYQSHRPEQTLLYQIVDEYYPHSLRYGRAGKELPAMCNGNLKNFSNAGGWSMAFYGFAASLATPSTWSLSAVSVAVSARAVGAADGRKCRLLVDEVLPEQTMRQWCVELPVQLRFLFGVVCGKGRNPTLKALASDILR